MVSVQLRKVVELSEIDTRFKPTQAQIYINETIKNTESCQNFHRYVFSLNEAGKALLPLSIAAKATGQSIQVHVDGCQDNAPKIAIIRSH